MGSITVLINLQGTVIDDGHPKLTNKQINNVSFDKITAKTKSSKHIPRCLSKYHMQTI